MTKQSNRNETEIKLIKQEMNNFKRENKTDHSLVKNGVDDLKVQLENLSTSLEDLKDNYVVFKTKILIVWSIVMFVVGISGSVIGAYLIKLIS